MAKDIKTDVILRQHEAVPADMKSWYKRLTNGTHALVTYNASIIRVNCPDDDDDGDGGIGDGLAMQTIDYAHEKAHGGLMFSISHVYLAVADSSHANLLIAGPPDSEFHIRAVVSGGGEFRLSFYEDTTVSNPGTEIPVINMNRRSSNSAPLRAFYGPTITALGNLLQEGLLPAGTVGRAVGASVRSESEWIFTNKMYLLRATNISGQARNCSINVEGYLDVPPET